MDNTLTVVCTHYPHPDDWSAVLDRASQVARIRAMVGELARLDAALFDAARDFSRMHVDDLDAVETHLRQALEALDAADQQQTETELRMG